ncbi:exodeoxyribonuclease VII large subunit [Novipirellula artificiosorum]|uniref:Exodeoxyribonuclease 7 large subunit n=1 Tax=Novipirellula artificiosorum TaxID=2528016 RepID=A0A5C6DLP5_9BACT|nr:exodeoxyribonuclease VII large subunit [Novipirellula artificiosorum]TWU37105.1 Exodeoxyribonuclease 7 large subunit [Novipirellula artificiosorum]
MNQDPRQAISVAELTGHIKAVVEQTFPSLWISGELSDLVRPRSGHLYFTLKGDGAQIRGVMWKSTAARMKHEIEDGQAVLCFGDVEVYGPRGTYQLVVRKMEPQGVGALQLAFQQLQAKLQLEGLFSADRKRPIPTLPRRIGIVTSPSGAAVRDFLKAASNRYRGAEIVVIPSLVQGEGASRSLVQAIAAAQRLMPALDVLVVSRGGGSLEDLWCFNEEPVVRAVAESAIPTISAVGHEIDVTLCDLVADLRALTPTDAATRVLPDSRSHDSAIKGLRQRLDHSARQSIARRQVAVDSLRQRPILRKPMEIVQMRWRMLDEYDARSRRAVMANLSTARGGVAEWAAALAALSPLAVLARGYSVTLGPDGQAVTDAQQLSRGDQIETKLNRGTITSTVL